MPNNKEPKEFKSDRMMELFFRALKGEALSVSKLAEKYNVTKRSISRDINNLKLFLSEHWDILGNAELVYSSVNHCYTLQIDNFISDKELLAISKILIGSRAFSQSELHAIISKMKTHTSFADRLRLETLISKEMYHYSEIGCDCNSLIDNIWTITNHIYNKCEITITYYKMDRSQVKHRIKPLSIMFSEYYFYLIAYKCTDEIENPIYFRVDRITNIIAHRDHFSLSNISKFDEGLLRKRSQFMWPGPLRKIRFEFTGPSLQAILDRLPTAKVVDQKNGVNIIEAEVFGDGIKMFLLSQGSWVKVLSPLEFVNEIKYELDKMSYLYK